jgi:hypothetical protein
MAVQKIALDFADHRVESSGQGARIAVQHQRNRVETSGSLAPA